MSLKDLIKLIEQWAIDRGLDKNGTVEGQLIKTAEEVAELIIGISKGNLKLIKDSIGDVFVTLVIGNMLDSQFDVEKCISEARDSFIKPERKIDLILFITHYLRSLLRFESYAEFEFFRMTEGLYDICDWYKLDFTVCVETAYNEIADRKGRVIDGTFVKEEDMI